MHLRNYLQTKHSTLLQFFTRTTESRRSRGASVSGISYSSRHQNVTKRKFMFSDKTLSKSSEFYYLEPGLYLSITEIVDAMNTLIQERHNQSENCITVKVSRRTQKVKSFFPKKGSGLPFFITDLEHIFGGNEGIEFGVILREKCPHKPEIAYIVTIYSLMIYTDLIESNNVGDTKAPLLRCFFLFRSSSMETK